MPEPEDKFGHSLNDYKVAILGLVRCSIFPADTLAQYFFTVDQPMFHLALDELVRDRVLKHEEGNYFLNVDRSSVKLVEDR